MQIKIAMQSGDGSGVREGWPQRPSSNAPHSIADVLQELLAQYRVRFPELRLAVVETSWTPINYSVRSTA